MCLAFALGKETKKERNEEKKKKRREGTKKGGKRKEERREEGRKERMNEIKRDFPGGSVVKTVLPMQGTWV